MNEGSKPNAYEVFDTMRGHVEFVCMSVERSAYEFSRADRHEWKNADEVTFTFGHFVRGVFLKIIVKTSRPTPATTPVSYVEMYNATTGLPVTEHAYMLSKDVILQPATERVLQRDTECVAA